MPNVYAATALLALGCHTSGGCTSMCMLSKAAGRAGQAGRCRQVAAGLIACPNRAKLPGTGSPCQPMPAHASPCQPMPAHASPPPPLRLTEAHQGPAPQHCIQHLWAALVALQGTAARCASKLWLGRHEGRRPAGSGPCITSAVAPARGSATAAALASGDQPAQPCIPQAHRTLARCSGKVTRVGDRGRMLAVSFRLYLSRPGKSGVAPLQHGSSRERGCQQAIGRQQGQQWGTQHARAAGAQVQA